MLNENNTKKIDILQSTNIEFILDTLQSTYAFTRFHPIIAI